MFDTNGSEFFAVLVALSLFVFFACVAWRELSAATAPSWTRVAVGASAAVLAVSALLALF